MVDLHSAVALTLLVNHVERLDLPITQEHQPGSPSVSSPTLSSLGMCSGGYLTPLVTGMPLVQLMGEENPTDQDSRFVH